MKKTKNNIIIGASGIIAGAVCGAIAGSSIYQYTWAYALVVFFAIIGFLTLGALVLAVVLDKSTDDFEDSPTSFPKPSGWDKRLEN